MTTLKILKKPITYKTTINLFLTQKNKWFINIKNDT